MCRGPPPPSTNCTGLVSTGWSQGRPCWSSAYQNHLTQHRLAPTPDRLYQCKSNTTPHKKSTKQALHHPPPGQPHTCRAHWNSLMKGHSTKYQRHDPTMKTGALASTVQALPWEQRHTGRQQLQSSLLAMVIWCLSMGCWQFGDDVGHWVMMLVVVFRARCIVSQLLGGLHRR